jgi:hypothetical protein
VTVSKVKYVLESSDEDEQLVAIMFMKDMNEARAIVATEWALFKNGQSAYTTAAEIENAATSIYFRLYTEFTENNPTFLRHRDLLVLLRPQPKPASTDMSVTSHTELTLSCERVATILEHCFTKPLEMVADVKLTVNPLQFLDDATLGLNHAEKMWLHTLSCLWILTELHRKETHDGSLAFDEGIKYGSDLHNLPISAMVHMRREKRVPTCVVFSLQTIYDTRLVNNQADRRLDSYLGLTRAYNRDVHA